MYSKVADFHRKFEINPLSTPGLLQPDVMDFRLMCLDEELKEIIAAYTANDIHEVADGLVDLVYFALGTAYLMGLPFNELFEEVHKANMKKVKCQVASDSKRNFSADLYKPEGWKQPDFSELLGGKL